MRLMRPKMSRTGHRPAGSGKDRRRALHLLHALRLPLPPLRAQAESRGAGGRQRHAEQGMLREEGMRAVSVRHGVREGCSSSGHHAGSDFRRRRPERSGDGRGAKGSVGQVRSGADGISSIHLRPRAGEAKCRPGTMSDCAG